MSSREAVSIGVRSTIRNWFSQIFYYPQNQIKPAAGDYADYWEKKRGTKSKLFSWQKARADFIVGQVKSEHVTTPTLADVGAGDGATLAHIMTRLPGSDGLAYDSSDAALSFLKAAGLKAYKLDLNTDVNLVGVGGADYILLLEVLEHVSESERVLMSALKKANRGVFISVPNSGFFTYRLRLLFGKFPAQWSREPNEHVRFWTLRDMRWWLEAQDLRSYVIRPYQGVPILNKILPSWFAAGMIIYIRIQ